MMVRSYLEWSLNASAEERAEAVGILADVYSAGDLSDLDRRDAEAALILALDDPSAIVRRALAQCLGASERAPRPIIAALAQDQADIAQIIIANSPLLSDAMLVDFISLSDSAMQLAIAHRPNVSPEVSAALADNGTVEAMIAVIHNEGSQVRVDSLERILSRFPEHGGLREALLERDDLPVEIRTILVKLAADQLTSFVRDCGWLPQQRASRLAQDCTEFGTVSMAVKAMPGEMPDLVRHLLDANQLTPQLLLRALLSGDTRLLIVTLSELAGVSLDKADGLVQSRIGMGFRAVYRKAGLPALLEPAFEAALSAWHELGSHISPGRLSRPMIEQVLTALALLDDPELDRLMALLMRYQAEAAREEARDAIDQMMLAPDQEMITPDVPEMIPRLAVESLTFVSVQDETVMLYDDADLFVQQPLLMLESTPVVEADDLEKRLSEALQEEFQKAA